MFNIDKLIIAELVIMSIGIIYFSLGVAPLLSMEVKLDETKKVEKYRNRAIIGAASMLGGLVSLILTILIFHS